MMRILVLMSTYNGEKYLKTQIESILSQENVEVDIIIRDDGSTDNTISILNEYDNYKNINIHLEENRGFIYSFSKLVEWAKAFSEYDYYAFADQDDEWYSLKLFNSANLLNTLDNSVPNICTSNSILIDEYGEEISLFRFNEPEYTIYNSLFSQDFQGCSMMFNYKAIELYCMRKLNEYYHDLWMFMICNFMGNTKHLHEPQFNYRLHGNNIIGFKINTTCKEKIKYWTTVKDNYRARMMKEFLVTYETFLNKDIIVFINQYLHYRTSFVIKLKLLFNLKCYPRQNGSLLWKKYISHLLFNKY